MEKCKKCGNESMIGVEYSYSSEHRYDGISEWECRKCGVRIGRWSGIELKDGEVEGRYGKSSPIKL